MEVKSMKKLFIASMHLVIALVLSKTSAANATLGEKLTDLASEGKKTGLAPVAEKVQGSYKQVDLQADNGTVRQFATTDTGQVFGIFWTGPLTNNITQLLGTYSSDLQNYDKTHPKRPGRIHYRKVDAGRVVFEFWDLRKKVEGRAYLPGQMPAGVTTDSIVIKTGEQLTPIPPREG